ncbi:3-hydroxybutyrate dehydrogenase [compost metagenome]|uniref:NADP-dependent 3-hydroxy acid dehydrogenase YdfG n=1 Tax=Achromobacter agilis TaxID=1353888 RepID=A0A446CAR8_9BURK|nr:SDR family oxidoreductase [Achromobacter agilis]SSW64997.1 NADP-dependent 3-hydroxy acid dehydrogenase YdfG [Achromobacter agilis]
MSPRDASVVLTGAAGGLGSAIARRLFEEGACLLLVGRSEAPLLTLARSLSVGARDRSRVDALVVDVTTDAGRAAVIDAAGARNANVLINNAAVAAFGPAQALQSEAARRLMETNVVAPMMLTAGMLPMLLTRPRAQVLNIGSTLGSLGVPGFSAYAASKAALRIYSEALRRELADSCVRVQYYAPRAIDTPFNSPEVQAFNEETHSASDSPEKIAQGVSRLLQSGSTQRYAGGFEAIAARLNGLFPEWLDGAFAKHRRALKSLKFPNGASS